MELWDVYDKNRNKTGKTHVRGVPMAEGERYRLLAACIVFGDANVRRKFENPNFHAIFFAFF